MSNLDGSLNDCPFCGGPAQFSECVDYCKVFCRDCHASTIEFREGDSARKRAESATAWNRRMQPTPEPLDGTDWHIVEEDGKSYVKVEFGVFVAYRKKMEGRPAVPGKPLEIQTRDELLAYIRHMEAKPQEDMLANLRAENERLRAALRPFAAKAQLCRDYEHEPETSGVWEFRAGNFYTAEQALTSQDNGGANG